MKEISHKLSPEAKAQIEAAGISAEQEEMYWLGNAMAAAYQGTVEHLKIGYIPIRVSGSNQVFPKFFDRGLLPHSRPSRC